MTTNSSQQWQLEPASAASRLGLIALVVGVPMVSMVLLPMLSADGGPVPTWTLLATTGFSLVLGLGLNWCMLRHRVAIADGVLEVTSSFYRRRVAIAELQLDQARVVDLREHTGLKPRFKTNGFSWFGFNSGRYRSRHGRMFVATAGGDRVLWVPTSRGFDLLLQPRRPQALLDHLREVAAPRAAR